MNERIKELRKILGLTSEKFGARLGVGKTAISGIETGRRNVTDQMFLSICREFNVNEEWLRTGSGDMFVELPPEDEYFKAATQLSDDPDVRSILISYWKQDDDGKKAIKKFISDFVCEIQKNKEHED